MSKSNDNPKFALTLQSVPGDVPAIIRLRKFLKMALRSYGLRCTEIREIPEPEPEPEPDRGPARPGDIFSVVPF